MELIIKYSEFRKRQHSHFLHQYEIPTNYYISLPMPTRRFGVPAYVFFACPTSIRPGQPVNVDKPEMWGAIDAQKGKILLYAQTKVLPFSKQQFEKCIFPKISQSVEDQEALLHSLENVLTEAANLFFHNKAIDANLQVSLKEILGSYLPQIIFPFYQAVSPDFFEWLA